MAEKGISKVQYSDGSILRIESVTTHVLTQAGPMLDVEQTREEVVESIENGEVYVTIISLDPVAYGDQVHVVEMNGEKFIRTDGNETDHDDLGTLPTF